MNLKILWHWTCGIEFSCVLSPWVPFLNILFLSAFIMTVSILTFQTWDGWIALPTQWTWVWANSGKWWRTGKPGVLQSMGLQRVRPNWVTEQQQQNMLKSTDLSYAISSVASTQSSSSHKLVWLHCQHLTFSSIRVRSNSGGLWCQDQGLASFLWKGPNCKYFKF